MRKIIAKKILPLLCCREYMIIIGFEQIILNSRICSNPFYTCRRQQVFDMKTKMQVWVILTAIRKGCGNVRREEKR